MGYHIRTGLVEEHESTLDMIYGAIVKGEALRFDCRMPEDINKMKYQFNRVLKATDVLITECGGRFKGIRQRVKVKEDWKNMAVVIEPVTAQTAGITAVRPAEPNEYDAVERLKQFTGSMDLIRFTPSESFDLAEWQLAIKEIGFDLVANPDEPGWIGGISEYGKAEYAVARTTKAKPTGFDMLKSFQSSGDMSQEP
jgi:hypothetical protein